MAFPLRFHSRSNCISMVQRSIATIVFFSPSADGITCIIVCFRWRNLWNGWENNETTSICYYVKKDKGIEQCLARWQIFRGTETAVRRLNVTFVLQTMLCQGADWWWTGLFLYFFKWSVFCNGVTDWALVQGFFGYCWYLVLIVSTV